MQVQVIRSVGPWSVGHAAENSIQNCWIQTIQNAQHFVYIENQVSILDIIMHIIIIEHIYTVFHWESRWNRHQEWHSEGPSRPRRLGCPERGRL